MIKNLPANAEETSLIAEWEGPLEKEMAVHSISCLGNPMTEEPRGLEYKELQKD